MKKKIYITGAGGYIGKNILQFLQTKYIIFAPSHKDLDLLNSEAIERFLQRILPDIIIHCAVVGGSRSEEYEQGMLHDNLRIFLNILRCESYYKRLIHIGSGAVYDKRYPIIKAKETDLGKRVPVDEYGFYKYICANYINKSNNMVDLRVFGMFGEGEDYRYRFISNAICRHIFGLPITMDRDVYFDYMDIQDFVWIVDNFIRHKSRYTSYNIGTGKKINLHTIADKINKIGGVDREVIVNQPGFNNEYTCDVSRLFQEVTSLHITPFDVSLKRLYSWYTKQKLHIQKSDL